ncbi:hypothetical protein PybrP1_000877 [[Pythium] brassicae (nom. inval.)]|nr:hypothetical protein PybrP1_000877 [[Pythium] brassicae (nom. inval.)]
MRGKLLVLALASFAASFAAARQQEDVKLVSACAANLSSPSPPVVAPLAAAFGAASVEAARTFVAATPLGALLFTPDASTCLANMDGAKVRDALSAALETPKCAPLRTVARLPAVRHLVGNMTAQTDIAGFARLLRNVSSAEFDEFCGLYVDGVVPCLATDLLPAVATIRATYASGCCDAWTKSAARDFGYTVTDLLLKYAQLFGDLVCARQTPSFQGNASQTCGFTFAQTALTANDSATLGAELLVQLQVPTDQMCLKAEGKRYVDVSGAAVAAGSGPRTVSGCVLPLDRAATWVSTLPLAQRTNVFDVQSLFAAGKCLKGSELFPVALEAFFPADVQAAVGAYFSKACVHVPVKFADGCSFARAVALVDWASEPSTVKPQDLDGAGGVSSDPTKSIVSFKTLVPVDSSGRAVFGDGGVSSAWRVVVAGAMTTLFLLVR